MFLFYYNYRNHNNKNVQLFSYYNTLLMRWYKLLICLNGALATDESKYPIILVYALLYCISGTSKTLHTKKKYVMLLIWITSVMPPQHEIQTYILFIIRNKNIFQSLNWRQQGKDTQKGIRNSNPKWKLCFVEHLKLDKYEDDNIIQRKPIDRRQTWFL